ncbi:MAG: hypothetical protein Q9213_004918 [Squamulea squamosa]
MPCLRDTKYDSNFKGIHSISAVFDKIVDADGFLAPNVPTAVCSITVEGSTMTVKGYQAKAADIKQTVASSTTCNSATVAVLKSLLLPEAPKNATQSSDAITAKSQTGQPTKGRQGRARKQPDIVILEAPDKTKSPLNDHDREKLATEIVNISLKALSEAVKSQSTTQSKAKTAPHTTSPCSKGRSPQIAESPLQPLCVNRVLIGKEQCKGSSRTRCTDITEASSGLCAQAECARLALSVLRTHQALKKSEKATPSLKIELAMSTLISKLIALELFELAAKELRVLKISLLVASGVARKAESIASDKAVVKAKITDLLVFQNTNLKGPLLAMIVTFQLQVTRWIVAQRNASLSEAAVEHLITDASYSPANLIQAQLDSTDPSAGVLVAGQMETLSQLAAAMSSSKPCSENHPASSRSMSPLAAFRLQMFSLELRSRWWKIADHRGNAVRDLLDPFIRFLSTFRRRCTADLKDGYYVAKNTLLQLERSVRHAELSSSIPSALCEARRSIYCELYDVAQVCSPGTEGKGWLEEYIKLPLDDNMSPCRRCTEACKSAAMFAQDYKSPSSEAETATALQIAVRHIEGDLHGSSDELDSLLLAIIKLRKASAFVINKLQAPSPNSHTSLSPEIFRACSSICSTSVLFLSRYLGNKPSASAAQNVVCRYQQRFEQASAVARTFIDSVVSIARLLKGNNADQWAPADAGLQGCLRLAATVYETDQDVAIETVKSNTTSNTFILVSNAYWLRYVYMKQNNQDAKEAQSALKASIKAVENRPLRESSTAQVQTRLEHYGSAMEAARDYRKAAEYYLKALRIHVEMGDLDRATTTAGRQSLKTVFDRDAEFAPLGRVLMAYPRVSTKIQHHLPLDISFFDDEKLELASRIIALEQQLGSLVAQVGTKSHETQLSLTVQAIGTRLLALYDQHHSLVGRLRVTETLLWFQTSFPGALSTDFLKKLAEDATHLEPDEIQMLESDLQSMALHLKASRDTALAIQAECPTLMQQKLENALGIWRYQVEQCPNFEGLEAVIGDIRVWLLHLELLAQYLDAYGLGLLRLSTLELLCNVRERTFPLDPIALVLNLTQYGLQCLRLGHISKAGIIFHRAHRYINESAAIREASVGYYIGYAEYLLATGSVGKCEENLAAARKIFERDGHGDHAPSTNSHNRMLQVVADVASLCSQLAVRQGHPSKALLFARQSLRIAHQTWKTTAKRQKFSRDHGPDLERKDDMKVLVGSTAEAMVSDDDRGPRGSAICNKAPMFWCLVPRLHRAFLQVANLYTAEGMLAEAKYYLERSHKFAEDISASGLLGQSLVQLADILTRSEDYKGANIKLDLASKLYSSLENDQQIINYYVTLSKYQLAKGHFSDAEQTCVHAEAMLQRFLAAALTKEDYVRRSDVDSLQRQLSRFTLGEDAASRPVSKKRITVKAPSGKVSQPGKETKTPYASSCDAPVSSSLSFTSLKNDILRQQVMLALRGDKLERMDDLLAEAATRPCTPQETVFYAIVGAELSLKRGLSAINGDPVFCVLPESTVCLPSVLPSGVSCSSNPPKIKPVKTIKGPGKSVTVSAVGTKMQASTEYGSERLSHHFRQAQLDSSKVYEIARTSSTTASLHRISKLLTETLVILSALGLCSISESPRPNSCMLLGITDTPMSTSVLRRQRVIQVEKTTSKEVDALCWPTDKVETSIERILPDQTPDITCFHEQYLDIIPQTWQVLTLSLSRTRGELVVSRLRSGQSPFILSMPLDRHSSRDPDEERFGYTQAKTELQEIVALADQSTHSTQDTSRKGARSAWWEERAALDARLRDLLANVEHMWFGGFHGVFSPQVPDRDLLSRFQVSLQGILDNHLPSRQGQGRKHQPKHISFDPRVAELFVALGEPSDLAEMEEPLADLLYFIIDILQLCGERNAYDEVDFDSMTIATFDALRQYHGAVKDIVDPPQIQHTIFVLDKELHCFPWESLPCLSNQAITRMPSLTSLRDRVLQQRYQQMCDFDGANDGAKRFCIDRRKSAYVLNPAGDLKATQETFEHSLSNTGEWEGLTGTEPSEEQIKGYLQEQDVFLYFGHGSGSQYIRPRTLQQLDRCAVALLMGCSSGKLTEAGEFEPYGTPMTYMQAGCPAMLATLWNVTDKDVDRFSESVLRKWGLLSSQAASESSPIKKTTRSRGKSKARHSPPPSPAYGNVSLDEAVAQGRDSCIFRYLNGAAPVVYGIPVFVA